MQEIRYVLKPKLVGLACQYGIGRQTMMMCNRSNNSYWASSYSFTSFIYSTTCICI